MFGGVGHATFLCFDGRGGPGSGFQRRNFGEVDSLSPQHHTRVMHDYGSVAPPVFRMGFLL